MTTAFQSIPVPLLRASSTNPRKHFDKAALDELAASLKEHGILQPILVRPLGNMGGIASHDCFEIVAGERRYRAAKIAKLSEMPATIRELTDKQVIEIQVIENVQREDLHPLEEAEGYEQLIKHHGYDVKSIAAKVGKSDSYVEKRLKLCALHEKARKAFSEGKLDLQRASLLARLPIDVQVKALLPVINTETYQDAVDVVRNEFMLRLAEAPFDKADTQLCPVAGACTNCPKRTGASPELFPDIKKDDLCLDVKCFDGKRTAHRDAALAKAKAGGLKVIDGAEAKRVRPYQYNDRLNGFVTLDERCHDDPKDRHYRALLGRDAPTPSILIDPHTGNVREIYPLADVTKVLQAKYPKLKQSRTQSVDPWRKQQAEKERKAKAERTIRVKILEAVRAKVGEREFDRADLVMVAESSYDRALFDGQARIATLWGWTDKRADVRECKKRIAALQVPELRRLLVDIALIGDTEVHSYSSSPPTSLLAAAKRYKVDAEKIRREATAAAKVKAKPKAKGKK